MKGSGPAHERETIINFNEEDKTVSIWTASMPIYRRLLKRLGSEYMTQDGERHAEFVFPKKWLVLPRKRNKVDLTPQQLQRRAANIDRLRAFRKKRTIPEAI